RARLDQVELGLEPRQTGLHLPAVGLLMDSALASQLVSEVLDHVGDVNLLARELGAFEASVKHAARRPHEGVALPVLSVAGLLADEHHARAPGPFADYGLRRPLPQITRAAVLNRLAQLGL